MMEAPKDRISNLPESILHHIHSFLGLVDGASTSVLSKRWNYIWTTVPTLDFTILSHPSMITSCVTDKFMEIVDVILHRHNSSNVDKFSLSWYAHLNEPRLHSWISTVIRGNVKELNLHLTQDHPLFIPLSLFTCVSLISLELDTQPNIRLPKYISFPRLRCLKLHSFMFTDECWNEELFSNSHVLEELILERCSISMNFLCISIPTLKLLKVDEWTDEGNGLRDCILKIDAPRLVTFSYTSPLAKELILSSFPALEEATVDVNFDEYDGVKISRLLRAVGHVKYLTVCSLTVKVVYSGYDLSNNLPTFHNVKELSVAGVLSTDEGLIALLKAVPNLESLVIDQYMLDEQEEDSGDTEGDGDDDNRNDDAGSFGGETNHVNHQEDISDAAECRSNDQGVANYGCLFPHLKSVCFESFAGNPREIRWVKLILRNAKALQMMDICYGDCELVFANEKSEKKLTAEIPSYPRASPGCVIKVGPWDFNAYLSR